MTALTASLRSVSLSFRGRDLRGANPRCFPLNMIDTTFGVVNLSGKLTTNLAGSSGNLSKLSNLIDAYEFENPPFRDSDRTTSMVLLKLVRIPARIREPMMAGDRW
uniref:(northern house mosquito) hypothetical protein n=1 Tax=Culex pipiens TaxID=7175 RepID=A0A8D8JGH2_CULPI